ncbi:putative ubiquitin-protein ligase [Emiliania huxleyi CCMP1516]|uniref:HECT-type E3 ubiquitin transferase n=2 Tax=Emiliania huxleyi TaxID=2903 RepID=A0A0D3JRR1_EMIH1|nr:putative ubiquitin-protein ligase [Emiliania huxleyi CCMP1516]EOD26196.1 putative ubiquitin-protein ligase [Emiliania huxleyi CCMP1516]|eukprot:XP_005778625.1 putative ubiquitin-protein ligase [Emiliania huxleyi CCMP1516]
MASSTSEAMDVDDTAKDRDRVSALVRRYFAQLTRGCGRPGCPNRHCRSSADASELDPTRAALLSLELAQCGDHALCDELPPFLSLPLLQQLCASASSGAPESMHALEASLAEVFSSAEALSRSFVSSSAAREAEAAQLAVDPSELSGVDAGAVGEAYSLLFSSPPDSAGFTAADRLGNVVMRGAHALLRGRGAYKLLTEGNCPLQREGGSLRWLLVLMANPLLLEPQHHKPVLLPLCSLIASLEEGAAAQVARWWSHWPEPALARIVAIQLFRWEELELLLCGSPNLDFEALERVTQYDDGFSCDSPCIALLWEVIHELPLEMKKKFLFFCTGSDRVPIKGLGNLSFVISRNGSDEERLPSAHTCFNHLLLPEYTTKSKLKAQLLKAVSDTEGFHII